MLDKKQENVPQNNLEIHSLRSPCTVQESTKVEHGIDQWLRSAREGWILWLPRRPPSLSSPITQCVGRRGGRRRTCRTVRLDWTCPDPPHAKMKWLWSPSLLYCLVTLVDGECLAGRASSGGEAAEGWGPTCHVGEGVMERQVLTLTVPSPRRGAAPPARAHMNSHASCQVLRQVSLVSRVLSAAQHYHCGFTYESVRYFQNGLLIEAQHISQTNVNKTLLPAFMHLFTGRVDDNDDRQYKLSVL